MKATLGMKVVFFRTVDKVYEIALAMNYTLPQPNGERENLGSFATPFFLHLVVKYAAHNRAKPPHSVCPHSLHPNRDFPAFYQANQVQNDCRAVPRARPNHADLLR